MYDEDKIVWLPVGYWTDYGSHELQAWLEDKDHEWTDWPAEYFLATWRRAAVFYDDAEFAEAVLRWAYD